MLENSAVQLEKHVMVGVQADQKLWSLYLIRLTRTLKILNWTPSLTKALCIEKNWIALYFIAETHNFITNPSGVRDNPTIFEISNFIFYTFGASTFVSNGEWRVKSALLDQRKRGDKLMSVTYISIFIQQKQYNNICKSIFERIQSYQ